MREAIEYFFAALDANLGDGLEPAQALAEAVSDYAYVWNPNNPGTPLSKAAQRVLLHIERQDKQQQATDPRTEALAALVHELWSNWMEYMFRRGRLNDDHTWVMCAWDCERWQRQMRTEYHNLLVDEQNSDREIAKRILGMLEPEELRAGDDNE